MSSNSRSKKRYESAGKMEKVEIKESPKSKRKASNFLIRTNVKRDSETENEKTDRSSTDRLKEKFMVIPVRKKSHIINPYVEKINQLNQLYNKSSRNQTKKYNLPVIKTEVNTTFNTMANSHTLTTNLANSRNVSTISTTRRNSDDKKAENLKGSNYVFKGITHYSDKLKSSFFSDSSKTRNNIRHDSNKSDKTTEKSNIISEDYKKLEPVHKFEIKLEPVWKDSLGNDKIEEEESNVRETLTDETKIKKSDTMHSGDIINQTIHDVRSGVKNNTLSVNPSRLQLPNSHISKNLAMSLNKLNDLKFLKSINSLKSKTSSNYEDSSSPNFNFSKKPTMQISDRNLTQSERNEFNDITFNQNFETFKKTMTMNTNNISHKESISKHGYFHEEESYSRTKDKFNFDENLEQKLSDDSNNILIDHTPLIDHKNIEDIEHNFNLNNYSSTFTEYSVTSNGDIANFYYEPIVSYIDDPEELIGMEIKEKVNDILTSIVNAFPEDNESESDSEDKKTNQRFTIFKREEDRKPSIRRTSINLVKLSDNSKSSTTLDKQIRSNYSKRKTMDPAFILGEKLLEKIKNININLDSSKILDRSIDKSIIHPINSSFCTNPLTISNSNLTIIQIRLSEIESKKDYRKLKLLEMANQYVASGLNQKIESVTKRKRLMKFYKSAFYTTHINDIVKNQKKSKSTDRGLSRLNYEHQINKVTFNTMNKIFNFYLFDIYLELFKELLTELLNQENQFYETDLEGNQIGKSILENFKIQEIKNQVSPYVSHMKVLIDRVKNGQGILQHFGFENHQFVNNFIIRDCIHNFKREKVDDKSIGKKEEKKGETEDNPVAPSLRALRNSIVRRTKKELTHLNHSRLGSFSVKSKIKKKLTIFDTLQPRKETFSQTSFYKGASNSLEQEMRFKKHNKSLRKGHMEIALLKDDVSVFKEKSLFNRNKTENESKEHEMEKSKKTKKNRYEYRYMTKENTLFRTNEIKTKILSILKSPPELILFYIKECNFPKFKEIFEKYKIDPNTIDDTRNSLLSLSVLNNSYEIGNYLLNMGADVNSQNNELNTPLHIALSFKNFKIANLLISKKANEQILNKRMLTPWQCIVHGQ